METNQNALQSGTPFGTLSAIVCFNSICDSVGNTVQIICWPDETFTFVSPERLVRVASKHEEREEREKPRENSRRTPPVNGREPLKRSVW